MRIVMIGATGLVGRSLADRLLGDGVFELHGVGRRSAGRRHPRFHEHVAPPAEWPRLVRAIGADAAASAIGTTWRAAGSEDAFRAVDLGMVTAFAEAARAGGARRMLTVSAVGADAGSSNFYLGVKGVMEQTLAGIGFDRFDVLRPGLLRGDRGPERRLGERLGIALSPLTNLLLRGPLARFAAIDASVVADAAAACLYRTEPGLFRHDNPAIRALAQPLQKADRIG